MRRLAAMLLAVTALSGCGGSSTPSAAAPTSSASPDEASPATPPSKTKQRLQGKWEIVKYVSDRPIPKESMPLIGDMFDKLRIEFSGSSQISSIDKHVEKQAYDVADDDGSSFKLRTKGGMFDGGQFRFVDDDDVEVVDKGTLWPGVSTLRRAK